MAAGEKKVSLMTYLASVPNNAKFYVVIPSDTTPYYTTKADILAGIAGGTVPNLNDVATEGNEITDNAIALSSTVGAGSSELAAGVISVSNASGYIQYYPDKLKRTIAAGGASTTVQFETPTGTGFLVFPNVVNATKRLATENYADDLITQLINGAPSDANTLKELNDKIIAINAIIGGSTADGDSLVNTVAELLAVFSSYPEGTDVYTILSAKINSSDIINNLTQVVTGKVLDAAQGKVLKDLIDSLTTVVSGKADSSQITDLQLQIDNGFRKSILYDNHFWVVPTALIAPANFGYSQNLAGTFTMSGNVAGSRGMVLFATTTTPGNITFKRRFDQLQLQGLTVKITDKISFQTNVSGQRFFHGLTKANQFSAPTNVDQTTLADVIGVCQLSSSTNMHVIHNDASGTATTIDLGSSYPCNSTLYDYFIEIQQNPTNYIVIVTRKTISTGDIITVTNTITTNIPVYNTGAIQVLTWMSNNATAAAASYLDGGLEGNFNN